ncbi:pyrroline-5-carboxylate reductase [Alkalibacillus haloalkaliphilus]|uniref:pyrroline-5-carboxylate reductase n=1 Tax=Alkalibacillus haloalkaliphilus TaxID=94136 RepID=UPI0002F0C915|nr:pyrroline-5-carboxylate reductase [Alkalibacillus haloalkaliphilus]
MVDQQIGFIGCGKMAQAIINGMIQYGNINPSQIHASAVTEETIDYVREKYEIDVATDNQRIASESDLLFLAVKPHVYPNVIEEIRKHVSQNTIIITIAIGVRLKDIELAFGQETKIIRSMPNTPSMVGEGMTVYCANEHVTQEDIQLVESLFSLYGEVDQVGEKLMDSIPAVSGSSPAYGYMFIEALADGAVKQGIPREQAYEYASQALLGAAKMVRDTDYHPGELKDQVCTPGGATIKAVDALEQNGFRGAIIQAMDKCSGK